MGVTYRSGWWPPRSCTWGAGSLSGTGYRQCAPGRNSGCLMTSKQDFSHHRSEEGATAEAQTIGHIVTALQGLWGALMLPMAALLSFPGTLPKCTMDTSINTQRWIQKQYLGNLLYIQGISPRTACSHHNCKKHQNCQCKAQVSQ